MKYYLIISFIKIIKLKITTQNTNQFFTTHKNSNSVEYIEKTKNPFETNGVLVKKKKDILQDIPVFLLE
jgi:predicted RND superfamily exporter protein